MNQNTKIIPFKDDDENNTFSERAQIKAQGIRLNILRKFVNRNLKNFGDDVHIEPGMLGRYERGTTVIHEPAVFKICINLRNKYNVFVDPNWLLKGEGLGPHIIKENSEVKLKNVQEIVEKYNTYYDDGNIALDVHNNTNEAQLFPGHHLTMSKLIDLEKEDELAQIEYLDVVMTLKKNHPYFDNGKSFVVKCTYDFENKKFIINKQKNSFEPIALKKSEIESIKIINGLIAHNGSIKLK
jgi:hypothetical protein